MKNTILLIDDHPLFLDATKNMLLTSLPYFQIFTAINGKEADDFLSKNQSVKLALLDIKIRDEDSLKLLRKIKQQNSETKVIILSGYFTKDIQQEYIQEGACDFIDKNEDVSTILNKILSCLSIDPKSIQNSPHPYQNHGKAGQSFENLNKLSNRQKEILKKILQGKPNKIIAYEENISEITVKIHVSAILKIMQADNRAHLIYLLNQSNIDSITQNLN